MLHPEHVSVMLFDPDRARSRCAPTGMSDRDGEIAAMVAAARSLGDRWVADECGFCDVTFEVARFAQRVRAIERPAAMVPPVGRALLAPMPGDQHSFGIAILAMRLREAGWEVEADAGPDASDLLRAAQAGDFTLIGLSVGHDRALARASGLVAALRGASRRRDVMIALGGPMLNGRGALARELGADLHADDAEDLVTLVTRSARIAA